MIDLAIRWKNPEAKNWTDVIPTFCFGQSAENVTLTHLLYSPRWKPYAVKCKVSAKRDVVYLDYAEQSVWNFNDGTCFKGILQISFDSLARRSITNIKWKDHGNSTFAPADADWTLRDSFDEIDLAANFQLSEEGKRQVIEHIMIERIQRNSRNVKIKKKTVLELTNALRCEICEFDFAAGYRGIGNAFCEVHHIRELASGRQEPTLDDLAILCANCHRMIHRTGLDSMPSVQDFMERYLVLPN